LFSEAEDEVLSARENKAFDRSALAPFVIQPATKTKFTSVIEKCSKLLQYHPESNLIEGAVMMIAKSYYYQNEYQKAERKFIELLESYPTSSFRVEAKLLLARAYYKMNDRTKAVTTAKELAEAGVKEGDRGLSAEAAVLLGEMELESKNFLEARQFYQKAADLGVTAEQRTRAQLNVAEIYVQQNDYRNALEAYKHAEDESDDYVNEYRSQIGQARMLTKLGRYEAALALLEDLVSNTNDKDFFGEISFEMGNVYAAMNDLQSAVSQYIYVDSTYARTEAAANSYYQLGMIYEEKLFLYDSARTAYNKGRAEFPAATVTPLLNRRAEYINKYSSYRTEIARYDTIREYILSPRDTSSISHDTLAARSDSTMADSLLDHVAEGPDTLRTKKRVIPDIPIDTVEARLAYNKIELASLFFGTIGRIDSAMEWYQRVLTEHAKSPYVARAMFALAQIYAQDSTHSSAAVDSLYREIITRFPESEFAAESKRHFGIEPSKKTRDEAEIAYASAERLMDQGKTVAAIDTFTSIVTKYPTSPLASKAMYSVGWLYEQVASRPDSAIASYKKLVDLYPKSEYAALVMLKLSEVELLKKGKNQGAKDSSGVTAPMEEGKKVEQKIDPRKVKDPDERSLVPPVAPEKKDPEKPKL
jgi:tetratricopeptide (TPR) repeat protein